MRKSVFVVHKNLYNQEEIKQLNEQINQKKELKNFVPIVETIDGIPILVNDPDSPKSQIYHTIAKILWEKISSGNEQLITPDIIVE